MDSRTVKISKTTKTCNKCERELPVSEFHRRSDTPDGLRYECKNCNLSIALNYHYANRERRLMNMRVASAKQNATRYGVTSTLTKAEFQNHLALNDYACEDCGVAWEELHHIIPMSQGGSNTINNVKIVCKACHVQNHRELREVENGN